MNSHQISLWLASDRTIQDWGWALFHSLWQNSMVATALALALGLIDRRRAELRYGASAAALMAMLLIPMATFGYLHQTGPGPGLGASTMPLAPPVTVDFSGTPVGSSRMAGMFQNVLPWAVVAWALGVAIYLGRLAGGYWLAGRMQQGAGLTPAPEAWVALVDELRVRLELDVPVRLMASRLDSPVVMGVMRPMILVPVAALAGMPMAQVEALLAHELAHVLRGDYLANLLQTAAEALLFYHPATWWVARQLRREREHCCDDVAVAVCGSATVYARALASLEERRVSTLALAANERPLLDRVSRLLQREAGPGQPRMVPLTLVTVAVLAAGSLVAAWQPPQAEVRGSKGEAGTGVIKDAGAAPVRAESLSERMVRPVNLLIARLMQDELPVPPTPPRRPVPPKPPTPPAAGKLPPLAPPASVDIKHMSRGVIETSDNGQGFRMTVRNGHVTELTYSDHGERWRTEDPAVIEQVQKLFEPLQLRAEQQRRVADLDRQLTDKQRREVEAQARLVEREARLVEGQVRRLDEEARHSEGEGRRAEERARQESSRDKAAAEKLEQEAKRFQRQAERHRELLRDEQNRSQDLRREQEAKMKAMSEDMERLNREMESQVQEMERENERLRKQLNETLEKLKREGKLRRLGWLE